VLHDPVEALPDRDELVTVRLRVPEDGAEHADVADVGGEPSPRRSRRSKAVAAAAFCALAGCGSADKPPPAAEPAVSPPLAATPAGRVVRVGPMPEGVAADAQTGLVAVGLRNPDALALVDGRTGRLVRRLRLPESARHLQLAGPGGPVLVPAERADLIVRVPLRRGRPTSTRVGRFPHDAAASGGRVLVTEEMADTATVVAGRRVVATLPAPAQPGGAAALPGGRAAVVSVRARVLSLYKLDPPADLGHVNAGVGPTHVVAAAAHLYVADTQGAAVLAFRLRPRVELQSRANAPGAPYGIAIDPARGRLWVTLTATNRLAEYSLAGGRAPSLIATFRSVRQPNSVAVDPRAGRVYVTGRVDGVLQIVSPHR